MASGLTDQDIEQLRKDINTVRQVLRDIQALGGKLPALLVNALNKLELAIKAGQAIGAATEDARKALLSFRADLYAACRSVEAEMRFACEAGVDRKWQQHGLEFVFSPKKKSVTRNLLDQIIKKLPDAICQRWERCARIGRN